MGMISNAAAEAMRPPRPHLRPSVHSVTGSSQTYLSSDSEDEDDSLVSPSSRDRSVATATSVSSASTGSSGGIASRSRRRRRTRHASSPRKPATTVAGSTTTKRQHRRCPTLEYSDDDEDSKFLKDLDSLIEETSNRWKLSVKETVQTTSSGHLVLPGVAPKTATLPPLKR